MPLTPLMQESSTLAVEQVPIWAIDFAEDFPDSFVMELIFPRFSSSDILTTASFTSHLTLKTLEEVG
jgi:hypothetical protein